MGAEDGFPSWIPISKSALWLHYDYVCSEGLEGAEL